MPRNMKYRLTVDCLMTAILILLMSYSLIGEAVHEWLGIGMLLLLLLHQLLNLRWYRRLGKGRYSAFRVLQTALVVLLLCAMAGSMVSGLILSQYVLDALPILGGKALARRLHLPCAYWSFVLMSLHLGLHWSMVLGIARRLTGVGSAASAAVSRVLGALAALYGAISFFRHNLLSYLLLRTHFVLFDFTQPLALFFADYISIMPLFIFLGCYAGKCFRAASRPKGQNPEAAQ